jgi:hypothetical protein
MPGLGACRNGLTRPGALYSHIVWPGWAMGLIWFFIGVVVGALALVVLPLVVAALGAALAIGFLVALPLILAIMILIGILAAAPALGYGLLFAALLVALWASDRKKPRLPPPR